uniref:Uncharacterized protein n=1 Tax=Plectus sambesii TaxID=2011161 RepID=A0A914X5Y1_9BILA
MAFCFLTLAVIGVLSVTSSTSAGKVGECRTECIERNAYKVVRVHLKEIDVNVGLCRNVSEGAFVFAYTCDRRIGTWSHDPFAEDAIEFVGKPCPAVDMVDEELMADCPSGDNNSTVVVPETKFVDEKHSEPAVNADEFARRLARRR